MTHQAPNSVTQDFTAATELLVVGPNVKDLDILLTGLARPMDILRLKHDQNPLEQIAGALKVREEITALHLLAHGEPGAIHLGSTPLDFAALYKNEEAVNEICSALAGKAKVALWACSVGWMEAGARFIDALEDKLGATVYASDRPVGAASLGGDWHIGTPSPFMKSTEIAYRHTLPTFDMDIGQSGAPFHTTFQETDGGVTMTVSGSGLRSGHYGAASLSSGYVLGNLSSGPSITVSFDSPVPVHSFIFGEYNGAQGGTYTFTVASGTGSAITLNSADIPTNGTVPNVQVSPSDWTSVTSFTITSSNGNFTSILDSIDATVSNTAPALGGTPADGTATEDVATAIDLSAYNVSDSEGNTVTLTLAVDRGTIASTDGNTTTGGVTVASSGTASMTLQGAVGDLNTYLNDTSKITYTTASNDTTSATLTVTPNDGTINGTADTVAISITAVNDAPTGTGLPATVTVDEDASGARVDLSSLDLSDIDSAGHVSLTLTPSAGTVGGSSNGGVVAAAGAGSARVFTGTIADLNSYLDNSATQTNFAYQPVSNVSGNGAATIAVTLKDSDGSSDVSLGTISVNVTAVNDNPTISGKPNDVTVVEKTASNLDLSASSFADIDSTGTASVILTASVGAMTATTGGGVTVTNSGSSAITLSGTFSNINSFLNAASNVQYTGPAGTTGDNAATLTITADDGDGSGNLNLGTVNLDIDAANVNPTVTGLISDASFSEDTQGNLDLSASNFADTDNTGGAATVKLTASEGTLTADAASGFTITGSGTSEVSISYSTFAGINTYLNTVGLVKYTGASNDAGENTATITVTANDGDGSGDVNLGTVNVDITAVNDAPSGTSLPTSLSFTEDTAGNLDLSALTLTDVDSGTGSVTFTLVASEGTLSGTASAGITIGGSGSTLTLGGTISVIDAYLNTASNIEYTGALNDNGAPGATLTATINDGGNTGSGGGTDIALGTINLNVTAVNDAPTASDNTITLNEDTSYTFKAADFNFADADSTNGNALESLRIDTFTLGTGDTLQLDGTDVTTGQTFSSSNIGKLVYTPAANANGAGLASFTFSVNDGIDYAASPSTLTLNVTDVAEPVVVVTPTPEPEPVVIRAEQDADNSNDTLTGASLNDTIEAGGGDDTVSGGDGKDSLDGGTGKDTLDGGNDDDFIRGGTGDDSILGATGDDTLLGGTDSDTIEAGDGDDVVWAGAQDDAVDRVTGGTGNDRMGAGGGNDTLDGGAGDDTLYGAAGDDTVVGGAGSDTLYGGAGDDTVHGGTGDDEVRGGTGNDTLTGGAGNDTFVFINGFGNDVISDFSSSSDNQDMLDLSGIEGLTFAALHDTATFEGGNTRLLVDGDNSILLTDIDQAELQALFDAGQILVA